MGIKMKMSYRDRKPDREFESFRYWNLKENEKEFNEKDEDDIAIEFNGIEIKICGFNKVTNEKDELVFAYKVKGEEELVLYYIPNNISDEDRAKVNLVMEQMTKINGEYFGFAMEDVKDSLKKIMNEKGIFDNDKSNTKTDTTATK